MKKLFVLLALAVPAAACADEATVATSTELQNEHRVSGTYEVPVPEELAAAASFTANDIRWRVKNGEARLDYDLPPGIVGRALHVDFRGPFDGATGTLTGAAGTAECTVAGTDVSCRETMRGLLPLAIDEAAVNAFAASDAVSLADRIKVAEEFAKDPIGIVHFTLPR